MSATGGVCCHRCGTRADGDPRDVRAVCEACGAWLHCCRNCELYAPGASNDCREPSAERVADKTAGNFCDWFRPAAGAAPAPPDESAEARTRLARLFAKKLPPAT